MAVGGVTSNIMQAFKAMLNPAAKTGIREVLTRLFPGAQTGIDTMVSFVDKLRELHMAGAKKTDENTLDTREFADEVVRLRRTFTVSLNPLHYVWAFVKFVFGFGSTTEAKVKELERFGGLANMPYGPTTYAVEACESLLKIIHDRRNKMQNFISRIFFPNKLAGDSIIKAAVDALKTWLPRIANIDQREHFANMLTYGEPDFIADNLGKFTRNLVTSGEKEIAELRRGGAKPPARASRPEGMSKA